MFAGCIQVSTPTLRYFSLLVPVFSEALVNVSVQTHRSVFWLGEEAVEIRTRSTLLKQLGVYY
jgi:hypothetical protein